MLSVASRAVAVVFKAAAAAIGRATTGRLVGRDGEDGGGECRLRRGVVAQIARRAVERVHRARAGELRDEAVPEHLSRLQKLLEMPQKL